PCSPYPVDSVNPAAATKTERSTWNFSPALIATAMVAAPMSCGNQGGDPSGSGILGGLLGSGALINVNALNTR
ncbi:hypothetical protein PSTT_06420, partial [Puccinia striiformis]